MKKILLFATLVTMIGCGGSGASSPFAGTWDGAYTVPASSQVGTAHFTVASDGTVTGTGVNTTVGVNFTITGSINDAGMLVGTLGGTTITGTLNGTLAIAGNGHLTGSAVQTISGGGTATANFDLIKQ